MFPLKPLQEKMKDKVGLILKHDINCFINRQLIYNYPEQLFADVGVMAIEHADFEGVERLALVLGGLGWFLFILVYFCILSGYSCILIGYICILLVYLCI